MSTLKSAEVFKKMGGALETHGKDVVAKIQAVYLFELRASKDSKPDYFTVDLKEGNGKSNNFLWDPDSSHIQIS